MERINTVIDRINTELKLRCNELDGELQVFKIEKQLISYPEQYNAIRMACIRINHIRKLITDLEGVLNWYKVEDILQEYGIEEK